MPKFGNNLQNHEKPGNGCKPVQNKQKPACQVVGKNLRFFRTLETLICQNVPTGHLLESTPWPTFKQSRLFWSMEAPNFHTEHLSEKPHLSQLCAALDLRASVLKRCSIYKSRGLLWLKIPSSSSAVCEFECSCRSRLLGGAEYTFLGRWVMLTSGGASLSDAATKGWCSRPSSNRVHTYMHAGVLYINILLRRERKIEMHPWAAPLHF